MEKLQARKEWQKNIPSNDNQRPATKATLPSKALTQDRRSNKELPRQKNSKRIYLHQISSARDTKGSALRTGRESFVLFQILPCTYISFYNHFTLTNNVLYLGFLLCKMVILLVQLISKGNCEYKMIKHA